MTSKTKKYLGGIALLIALGITVFMLLNHDFSGLLRGDVLGGTSSGNTLYNNPLEKNYDTAAKVSTGFTLSDFKDAPTLKTFSKEQFGIHVVDYGPYRLFANEERYPEITQILKTLGLQGARDGTFDEFDPIDNTHRKGTPLYNNFFEDEFAAAPGYPADPNAVLGWSTMYCPYTADKAGLLSFSAPGYGDVGKALKLTTKDGETCVWQNKTTQSLNNGKTYIMTAKVKSLSGTVHMRLKAIGNANQPGEGRAFVMDTPNAEVSAAWTTLTSAPFSFSPAQQDQNTTVGAYVFVQEGGKEVLIDNVQIFETPCDNTNKNECQPLLTGTNDAKFDSVNRALYWQANQDIPKRMSAFNHLLPDAWRWTQSYIASTIEYFTTTHFRQNYANTYRFHILLEEYVDFFKKNVFDTRFPGRITYALTVGYAYRPLLDSETGEIIKDHFEHVLGENALKKQSDGSYSYDPASIDQQRVDENIRLIAKRNRLVAETLKQKFGDQVFDTLVFEIGNEAVFGLEYGYIPWPVYTKIVKETAAEMKQVSSKIKLAPIFQGAYTENPLNSVANDPYALYVAQWQNYMAGTREHFPDLSTLLQTNPTGYYYGTPYDLGTMVREWKDIKQMFAGMVIHIYGEEQMSAVLNWHRNTLEKEGFGDIPFWITEVNLESFNLQRDPYLAQSYMRPFLRLATELMMRMDVSEFDWHNIPAAGITEHMDPQGKISTVRCTSNNCTPITDPYIASFVQKGGKIGYVWRILTSGFAYRFLEHYILDEGTLNVKTMNTRFLQYDTPVSSASYIPQEPLSPELAATYPAELAQYILTNSKINPLVDLNTESYSIYFSTELYYPIRFAFENSEQIEKIRIKMWDLDKRLYRYYVQGSNDGTNWQMIEDDREQDIMGWHEMAVNTSFKYIRLIGTANSQNGNRGFHPMEVEIYNSSHTNIAPQAKIAVQFQELREKSERYAVTDLFGITPSGNLRGYVINSSPEPQTYTFKNAGTGAVLTVLRDKTALASVWKREDTPEYKAMIDAINSLKPKIFEIQNSDYKNFRDVFSYSYISKDLADNYKKLESTDPLLKRQGADAIVTGFSTYVTSDKISFSDPLFTTFFDKKDAFVTASMQKFSKEYLTDFRLDAAPSVEEITLAANSSGDLTFTSPANSILFLGQKGLEELYFKSFMDSEESIKDAIDTGLLQKESIFKTSTLTTPERPTLPVLQGNANQNLVQNRNNNTQQNQNTSAGNTNSVVSSNTNAIVTSRNQNTTPVQNKNIPLQTITSGGGGGAYIPTSLPNLNGNVNSPIHSSAPTFVDTKGHFAENAIERLAAQGILKGRTLNTFEPNGMLNRAESTVLIIRAFRMTEAAAAFEKSFLSAHPSFFYMKFKDVPIDSWFSAAVGYLHARGVVQGRSTEYFIPSGNITRAEFIKLVSAYVTAKTTVRNDVMPFKDVSSQAWYILYIEQAYRKGIIQPAERFRPDAYISRGEAAMILERAMK